MSLVDSTSELRATIESIYRRDSRRILASLIRLLGDFDLAEEAMHDGFASALQRWSHEGVPDNPRAWLISTSRFKAIDRIRRRARFERPIADAADLQMPDAETEIATADVFDDDLLRLIFTCCHPSLGAETRIALTLREVCGLTTEEIARAFLLSPTAIAQRIVRAKAKIRDARIPYAVPERSELSARLASVSRVAYLVFNEGYLATSGEQLTRRDLCTDAIRLARLLVELLGEPESRGLLALMLLHESRRPARCTADGELVSLEDQDRGLWNPELIAEGEALAASALSSRPIGPYALQAGIAGVHAAASRAVDTDWHEIVGLYDVLFQIETTPVVALNRAAAIAMRDGPSIGLALVDELLATGELDGYHLAHAARADLCRRLGRTDEARAAYRRALALTKLAPERRLIERRLSEL